MGKSFGYYILMALTWPMQLFRLEFHYNAANFIYFVVYRLLAYRRDVVRENLRNSFPLLSPAERKEIERDFYKQLADLFIETLYFTHINVKKEKRRLEIQNFSEVEALIAQKKNIIVVMGHFGNWEFLQLFTQTISSKVYFVYKKLNNRAFDQFFKDLRGRAGIPLEMKQTFRQLYSQDQNEQPFLALFISDQRPVKGEIKHWVKFMNQDTPVLLGTEKIARKTGAAVLYLELVRKKRGYYSAKLKNICNNATETSELEITNQFMKMLEGSINKYPEQYLWTHKRWKYKKE